MSILFFVMQMMHPPPLNDTHFKVTIDQTLCDKFHECKSFLIEVMTSDQTFSSKIFCYANHPIKNAFISSATHIKKEHNTSDHHPISHDHSSYSSWEFISILFFVVQMTYLLAPTTPQRHSFLSHNRPCKPSVPSFMNVNPS